jgi:hypothetical protein
VFHKINGKLLDKKGIEQHETYAIDKLCARDSNIVLP